MDNVLLQCVVVVSLALQCFLQALFPLPNGEEIERESVVLFSSRKPREKLPKAMEERAGEEAEETQSNESTQVPIEIRFNDRTAKNVAIAGDFDNWVPVPMQKDVNGFRLSIKQPQKRTVQYKLLVDGEWRLDQNAKIAKNDGWNANNVIS